MFAGTMEQGLIYAIMALGVYTSYKILNFADMTVDGAFPLGGAIAATLIAKEYSPIVALLGAVLGGALAGAITGLIHVRLKVSNLLAGIIVMTGLYSINIRIMGKSNIPLFGKGHLFNMAIHPIVVIVVSVLVAKLSLDYLLKTKFGFALKALGDNESLIIGLGLNEQILKIQGLMIANSLVALSGGILSQYQGFADVGMGTGTILIALASVIIGDTLFGKLSFLKGTTVIVMGTIVYRSIISIALRIGLNPSDLRLVTSLIMVLMIYLKLKIEEIYSRKKVIKNVGD